MKIVLIVIGKTNEKYLKEGIDIYLKRLIHYSSFEYLELKDSKKFIDTADLKKKEAEEILAFLKKDDILILLDEKGSEYTSIGLSRLIEKYQIQSSKRLVFVVGGAYGFNDKMYNICDSKLSLSKMTFSHQMIRLFFLEQLYRAFTILKGEKYHNE